METPLPTRWSIVEGAAAGDPDAARVFAETYLGIVRAYLLKRWRGRAEIVGVDDALQEVFLDFFREGGALTRVDPERGGFRNFLFGVVHNIALRHEERALRERASRASDTALPQPMAPALDSYSRVFDRTWAMQLMQRARTKLVERAAGESEALQRLEILRLRFSEDLPIRTIAERLHLDPVKAHREYARVREEFKVALRSEIAGTVAARGGDLEKECRALLELFT